MRSLHRRRRRSSRRKCTHARSPFQSVPTSFVPKRAMMNAVRVRDVEVAEHEERATVAERPGAATFMCVASALCCLLLVACSAMRDGPVARIALTLRAGRWCRLSGLEGGCLPGCW